MLVPFQDGYKLILGNDGKVTVHDSGKSFARWRAVSMASR
jgi:hypothetical protein